MTWTRRTAFATFLPLGVMLLASTFASAQTRVGFNLSGMWSSMYHEDELERTDPGSPMGDYLGIPINDDAPLRADTWDADLISVLEHQCIPHSSVYAMRAPSNLKISTIDDPTTAQIIAFVIDGTYTGPRTISGSWPAVRSSVRCRISGHDDHHS